MCWQISQPKVLQYIVQLVKVLLSLYLVFSQYLRQIQWTQPTPPLHLQTESKGLSMVLLPSQQNLQNGVSSSSTTGGGLFTTGAFSSSFPSGVSPSSSYFYSSTSSGPTSLISFFAQAPLLPWYCEDLCSTSTWSPLASSQEDLAASASSFFSSSQSSAFCC